MRTNLPSQMKLIQSFFLSLIFMGVAHSATPDATLIIKYPYHSMAFVSSEAAKVSVNGAEPILMDADIGAGDILTVIPPLTTALRSRILSLQLPITEQIKST